MQRLRIDSSLFMLCIIHKRVLIIGKKWRIIICLCGLGSRTALKSRCKHLCAFALSVFIQNEDVQVRLPAATHIHSHDLLMCTARDAKLPLACKKSPIAICESISLAYRVAWQDSYIHTQHPTLSRRASSPFLNSIMLRFHSRPSEHTHFLLLTSPIQTITYNLTCISSFKAHRNMP